MEGNVTEKYNLQKDIVCNACSREKDDYCPRKQLERLMDSSGEPNLVESKKERHSDGSVSLSVVDANYTLEKCLHKVDSFVKKYVGEDLRKILEVELKRRHEMKIKSTIQMQATASAKAIEKAKTCDEIEWSTLITTNTLNKLYVSQLNLCLIEKIEMSKSKYEARGFSKAMKIEEIKRHFYSTQNSGNPSCADPKSLIQPSKQQSTSFSIPPIPTAVSPSGRPPPTILTQGQPLRVPPWGGACFCAGSAYFVSQLKNTCPIDNYLTIFYVLMCEHNSFLQYLNNSIDDYARTLIKVKDLFDQGMHFEGKMQWLSLFPGRFNMNVPILDLWGNEEELFLSHLRPVTCTTYSGTCSSFGCPKPIRDILSHSIALR